MSITAFENTTTTSSDTNTNNNNNNRIIRQHQHQHQHQHQQGMMWIYNNKNSCSSSCSETAGGDNDHHDLSSSSSSSIGNDSDSSAGPDDDSDDDTQVQSLSCTTALEHALPIKRGISTFYAGKSKSYTSLSDAVSVPSIHDIVKPQDAYNRKRKNILAHSLFFHNTPHPNPTRISNTSASHPPSRPPLPTTPHPARRPPSSYSSPRISSSPCRSFSLSDLQHASASSTTSTSLGNKTVEADH